MIHYTSTYYPDDGSEPIVMVFATESERDDYNDAKYNTLAEKTKASATLEVGNPKAKFVVPSRKESHYVPQPPKRPD